MTYSSIKNWSEDEKPREKLQKHGRQVLSDAELVGILLGSGTKSLSAIDVARKLLDLAGNNLNALAKLSIKDLCKINGIGPAKAVTISAALELGQRREALDIGKKTKLTGSRDAYQILKAKMQDLNYEQFWILTVARNNTVINAHQISDGGVSSTMADPKRVFKVALDDYAAGIVLAHNHPSGNLEPSTMDKKLTKRLKEGALVLDIAVLDHIIVTQNGYCSFSDEDLL